MKRLEDFISIKKPWLTEGVEWREVKLGDNKIAEIIMGQSPPSSSYNKERNGKPFLQGNKEFGEFYPRHVMYTTDPKKMCKKDDVLISVRAPVGDINIADREYCIGRGLAAIRFYGEPKYLFYLLISMKEEIEELGKRGTTFKAITKNHLKNLKVPIPFRNGKPDLETQRRIVEYIEANFSRIDKILEWKKRELAHLDELWESVLDQAFRPGPGEEWREVRLGEISHIIRGVSFKKSEITSINQGEAVITATHIQGDHLIMRNLIFVPAEKVKPIQKIKSGDIVIVMSTGSRTALGRTYYSLSNEDVYIGAFLGIIRCLYSQASMFVYFFTKTQKFKEHLLGYTGSQINNISISKLKNLKIPLPFCNGKPDLEKQREIGKYLDGVYEKIKALREKIQRQIDELEEMKESILEEVFNHDVKK